MKVTRVMDGEVCVGERGDGVIGIKGLYLHHK